MNLMQLPDEWKNQDIEVDVVLPLFSRTEGRQQRSTSHILIISFSFGLETLRHLSFPLDFSPQLWTDSYFLSTSRGS
jgi:hypothetical protein